MISKNVLNKALEKIKQSKKNADLIANNNLQNALKNKEFNQIYKLEKQAQIETARCEVYGLNNSFNLDEIAKQKSEILKKLNIDESTLLPKYSCKKCDDTGYENGKMCSCLKKLINEELYKQSGLNHKLNSFNKDDCKIFDDTKTMQQIYKTMQKWCNSPTSNYLNITLTGKTGVGKTHLMECMADDLIKNENIVFWTSAFNLNQLLLKYHTTFDETKLEYISNLLDADYLFIDDLGTEPILKNVTIEGLYNIISERVENNKKTIISTNLNPDEIQKTYGERIFSRLLNKANSLCINIENKDLRLIKK